MSLAKARLTLDTSKSNRTNHISNNSNNNTKVNGTIESSTSTTISNRHNKLQQRGKITKLYPEFYDFDFEMFSNEEEGWLSQQKQRKTGCL